MNGNEARQLIQTYVGQYRAGKLDEYKNSDATYMLFRKRYRRPRQDDGLGPYRYFHDSGIHDFTITQGQQALLQENLGIDMAAWDQDGTINIPAFASLFARQVAGQNGVFPKQEYQSLGISLPREITVLDLVKQEALMYMHHQRLIGNRGNLGWLRVSFFSIGQQIVRQSPRYFLLYAALRPDRNTRLISYPYYMKFSSKRDKESTAFRHIDFSIKRAI